MVVFSRFRDGVIHPRPILADFVPPIDGEVSSRKDDTKTDHRAMAQLSSAKQEKYNKRVPQAYFSSCINVFSRFPSNATRYFVRDFIGQRPPRASNASKRSLLRREDG